MSSTLSYYEANAIPLCERYAGADVREFHRWLLASIPHRSRVLELGCGCGREAAFLLSNGFEVIATDGSQQMLLQAARLYPELSGQLDVLVLPHPLPFPDDYFDAVLASAVLMHLTEEEIRATLGEVRRVLKIEGRLALSVPESRSDVDEKGIDENGRRFTQLRAKTWHEMCQAGGLDLLSERMSDDALGRRGIRWINALYAKHTSISDG